MRWPLVIPAGLAAVLAVCSTAPTEVPSDRLRILFIGNSLTAANIFLRIETLHEMPASETLH